MQRNSLSYHYDIACAASFSEKTFNVDGFLKVYLLVLWLFFTMIFATNKLKGFYCNDLVLENMFRCSYFWFKIVLQIDGPFLDINFDDTTFNIAYAEQNNIGTRHTIYLFYFFEIWLILCFNFLY